MEISKSARHGVNDDPATRQGFLGPIDSFNQALREYEQAQENLSMRQGEVMGGFRRYEKKQREKYIGETGKRIKVSGPAKRVVKREPNAWVDTLCQLDGDEMQTVEIKVDRFNPALPEPERYVDKSDRLRATDIHGNTYWMELDDKIQIEFLDE